jgi:hypothetical protein
MGPVCTLTLGPDSTLIDTVVAETGYRSVNFMPMISKAQVLALASGDPLAGEGCH